MKIFSNRRNNQKHFLQSKLRQTNQGAHKTSPTGYYLSQKTIKKGLQLASMAFF